MALVERVAAALLTFTGGYYLSVLLIGRWWGPPGKLASGRRFTSLPVRVVAGLYLGPHLRRCLGLGRRDAGAGCLDSHAPGGGRPDPHADLPSRRSTAEVAPRPRIWQVERPLKVSGNSPGSCCSATFG